jgi:hypothetical protein
MRLGSRVGRPSFPETGAGVSQPARGGRLGSGDEHSPDGNVDHQDVARDRDDGDHLGADVDSYDDERYERRDDGPGGGATGATPCAGDASGRLHRRAGGPPGPLSSKGRLALRPYHPSARRVYQPAALPLTTQGIVGGPGCPERSRGRARPGVGAADVAWASVEPGQADTPRASAWEMTIAGGRAQLQSDRSRGGGRAPGRRSGARGG